MNEDQWLALAKSQQDASYREGYNAARDEYVPVLMEHLRILADLRAQVEALSYLHRRTDDTYWVLRDDVVALLGGGSHEPVR